MSAISNIRKNLNSTGSTIIVGFIVFVLVATFGAGLTCGAGVIKWGQRVSPINKSSKKIPDYDGSIFDLMEDSFKHYGVDASHLLTS